MNKTAVADASAATNEGPETSGGQPARASNIDAIVAYFESGITPAGTAGELGIELELNDKITTIGELADFVESKL